MRRHHFILISPGRFPAHEAQACVPGTPKPRIHLPHNVVSSAARQEVIR